MKYGVLIFLVGLFTVNWSAPARAGVTAGELQGFCASSYDTDYGFCAGYLTAIAERMLQAPVAGFRACNHQMVKSQQLIEIITGELSSPSLDATMPAEQVVAAALSRAFPCFR